MQIRSWKRNVQQEGEKFRIKVNLPLHSVAERAPFILVTPRFPVMTGHCLQDTFPCSF